MKMFLQAARFLVLDMASTILFVILLSVTHNIGLAVAVGVGMGVAQIGYALARRQNVDAMQWLSLVLVILSGAATFFTHDPRFVMVKGTVIGLVVAGFMLRRGWMARYMPAIAVEKVPDLVVAWGYVWAAAIAGTAVLNLVLALTVSLGVWLAVMAIVPLVSKIALFVIQFTTMRFIGQRRARRAETGALAAA